VLRGRVPLLAGPDHDLADLVVMCAPTRECKDISPSQKFRDLVARRRLEMHAAQDSTGCTLGLVCRVLDRHFPAVFRPAVEFRLTAFDQHVGGIGQRDAHRRSGVANFESRDRARGAFDMAYAACDRSNLVTELNKWIPVLSPMRLTRRDHLQMALPIMRKLDRHVGFRIEF
jgi:hypothetical protein